jgi:hypothetical protein
MERKVEGHLYKFFAKTFRVVLNTKSLLFTFDWILMVILNTDKEEKWPPLNHCYRFSL